MDKQGRCIIISCYAYNTKYTLRKIYAPNAAQVTLTSSLGAIITRALQGPQIMSGPFNLARAQWQTVLAAHCPQTEYLFLSPSFHHQHM